MPFSLKKFFNLKLFFAANILLLAFFSFNLLKEYSRNRQLDGEIKKMEAQAKELEAKNLNLLNLTKYLDSEEFFESEARVKLGFQKPGEQAIVVDAANLNKGVAAASAAHEPNWRKWWKYFFGRK